VVRAVVKVRLQAPGSSSSSSYIFSQS
jgi:hypothetical protein